MAENGRFSSCVIQQAASNLSLEEKKKIVLYQILHTSADFDECFCTTTAQGNKREFWKRVILRSDRKEVK